MSAKQKEIINYIIFGVLTTVINILCFCVLDYISNNILINNVIAWFISIVFAYITNALYVFKDQNLNLKTFFKFTISRSSTLILECLLLLILINFLGISDMISKIITNVIVIILNYILSKILVFKN